MLYHTQSINGTLLGIWKVDESRDELLSYLDMDEDIEAILSTRLESRLLEKLAVRVLLKELLGTQKPVLYLDSGYPYFADGDYNLSISHSKGYVSVALDKDRRVGLDIEHISEKIRRVRSRVVSANEYIDTDRELIHLLLHWSAKEALFKVLRLDSIDFLGHLHIGHFTPRGDEGYFEARETKTPSKQKFDEVYYRIFDDFVLVCLSAS